MDPHEIQDQKIILMEMFPETPEARIDDIIDFVREDSSCYDTAYQLESMIDMLTGSEDHPGEEEEEDDEEGAVGYANHLTGEHYSERHFNDLKKLFPGIDASLLREELRQSNSDFDFLVDKFSKGDYYQKSQGDSSDIWEQLKSMLPGADPLYLKDQARRLCGDPSKIDAFVNEAVENNNYPTMQDYFKHQKQQQSVVLYTDFNIDEYLENIPNPPEFFDDPDRKASLSTEDVKEEDVKFAQHFLYNHYSCLRKKDINKMFNHYKRDMIKTSSRLDRLHRAFRTPRERTEVESSYNVVLLQEIAYIQHKKLIKNVLKMKDQIYRETKENAKAEGYLQKCDICYDDELLPEECFFCENNCTFCNDCIKGETNVTLGKGSIHVLCLARCGAEISISTLKMVLSKKTFDLLAQKRQVEEIKNANIDGLETCPHCDFSMIPNQDDKVFKCQNVDCMKETCRECLHPAHVPLRCNEIEYSEDIRMRTYIEDQMTRALLRECYKCKKEFIKSSGCNKMACPCGALMCYLCGAAVRDYSHFGDGRCALFTDIHQLHQARVIEGAQRAKQELGIVDGSETLKFDPTRGLEEYFRQLPPTQ